MKKSFLVLFVALFVSFSVAAQENESYRSVLEKYFEVQGTYATMNSTLETLMDIYKDSLSIPDDVCTIIKEKMHVSLIDVAIEFYEPIYSKYLSIEDLKELIKFYESPVGKRIVAANPAIVQETMSKSFALGQKIAGELVNELAAAGYFEE